MTNQEAEALMSHALKVLQDAKLDPGQVVRILAPLVLGIAVCRECGCTDISACEDGCSWVAEDVCSACVPGKEEDTGCGSI